MRAGGEAKMGGPSTASNPGERLCSSCASAAADSGNGLLEELPGIRPTCEDIRSSCPQRGLPALPSESLSSEVPAGPSEGCNQEARGGDFFGLGCGGSPWLCGTAIGGGPRLQRRPCAARGPGEGESPSDASESGAARGEVCGVDCENGEGGVAGGLPRGDEGGVGNSCAAGGGVRGGDGGSAAGARL